MVSSLTIPATVRSDNTGALFALMAVIGAASVTLLPIALELAVEVTRNADGSSAILWFWCAYVIAWISLQMLTRRPITAVMS